MLLDIGGGDGGVAVGDDGNGGAVDDNVDKLFAGDAVSTPTMSSLRTMATKSPMICLLRCHQEDCDGVPMDMCHTDHDE